MLAPPPFFAARAPLPPRVGPAFCRETLARLGNPPYRLWLPWEGAGPLLSCLVCHAARDGDPESGPCARLTVGGGAGWGVLRVVRQTKEPRLSGFPPKFPLSEVETERSGCPRPHPLPVLWPFPAGEAPHLLCGEELIWLLRLHYGVLKAISLSLVRPVPLSPGEGWVNEKWIQFQATGLGT